MDRNLVLLNRNIARLRRDVRLQSCEIEHLIAADLDCTPAAAEDNEVVSLGDDVSLERVATASQTPMLQEPVHVDVGQQWTRDAASRRAARVSLAATLAPGSIRVPFLDRRPQPHLDEAQDVSIHDTPGH